MEKQNEKIRINIKTIIWTVLFTILFSSIFCFTIMMTYRAYHANDIYRGYNLKPVIYLYPEEETEIEVKLGSPEKLSTTYPKYEDYWKVIAQPNGDLIDVKTGRSLYCLYWEGKNDDKKEITEGFCVKGEDSASFLEEKLKILGLNEREANEFIIYWLPKLECNKYNLISFETKEEIEKEMPIEVSPKPDTIIRILMKFKGSDKEIDIKEQKLDTVERKGYTLVEWGGTMLNDN